MEILVWALTGAIVGWVGYAGFGYNEARGRNVSMVLGIVGGLIGAKAIAPMFIAMPAGDFSAGGIAFAALAASAVLFLGNMVYNRWGL